MVPQRLHLRTVGLMVMLTVFTLGASDGGTDSSLYKILKKREAGGPSAALPKSSVAVPPSKAQEFLAKLSRTKRNIWDRSRPDVQQWIMQFMYMGYDEQVSNCPLESSWDEEKQIKMLERGWRQIWPTGGTRHAPLTRGVNITTMRTRPSAPGTTALTDTVQTSTMTTINLRSTTKKTEGTLCNQYFSKTV
uniref:ECRG4 augurin precursor a n=1 Tax=Cynoglossus semilaevis TaxID=244447 RepID=A0A3P8V238_CYNSE